MAPDWLKALEMYDRGVITHHELVFHVVAATTEYPTAEFIALLPDGVLDSINSLAKAPADTRWVSIASWCGSDIEARERMQQEERKRWLAGLAWWRYYFGPRA